MNNKETLMAERQLAATYQEAASTKALVALMGTLLFMTAAFALLPTSGWTALAGVAVSLYFFFTETAISYRGIKKIEWLESQIKAIDSADSVELTTKK